MKPSSSARVRALAWLLVLPACTAVLLFGPWSQAAHAAPIRGGETAPVLTTHTSSSATTVLNVSERGLADPAPQQGDDAFAPFLIIGLVVVLVGGWLLRRRRRG